MIYKECGHAGAVHYDQASIRAVQPEVCILLLQGCGRKQNAK